MASLVVASLFQLEMKVRDRNTPSIPGVSANTLDPHHVIDVENISTLPRRAKVTASLPYGTLRLEFQVDPVTRAARVAGTGLPAVNSATWWGDTPVMNNAITRRLECMVIRNGGPAATGEPLQCDEVQDQRGNTGWQKVKSRRVPWQITVNAN